MKRLLLSVLVFISIQSYSQNGYPVKQTLGSDSTIITSKGAFKSRIIHYSFTDTLDANSQHIDEYPGAHIFTVSDNKLWYRSADTSAWLLSVGDGQDTVYVTDDLYVVWNHLGQQVIHRFHNDGLLSGGIVSWTGTGLTFAISPAIYYLNQIRYMTGADTITLDPSDPSLPRRDVFIVDTIPDIGFITGTAAADPVTPQEDPPSQIILAEILLNAGDVTPSNVIQNKIYDENIEWTTSTTGTLTIDFDNTDNPYIGVKAAFVSSYHNNSKLRFTYSGTETVTTGQTLKMFFYSNGAYTNKLRFQFYNTNAKASNSLQINSGFGLNPTDSNNYQNISIPLSAFVFTSTTFNRLIITNVGNDTSGSKGYYIDNVQLQTGITNIPPLGGTRFGKAGEDVTATENRDFNLDNKTFTIFRTDLSTDYVQFSPTYHDFYLDDGTSFTEIVHTPDIANMHAQTFGGNVADLTLFDNGNIELSTTNAGRVRFSNYGTGTKTGTPAYNLVVDASGNIIESATPFGITTPTFQQVLTAGSTLTQNNIVTLGAFKYTTVGTNTTRLAEFDLTSNGLPIFIGLTGSTTNSIEDMVNLTRRTSGTAANGIGGSIDWYITASDGSAGYRSGYISNKWIDVTVGTRTSQFDFVGVNSTADETWASLNPTGITITSLAGTGSRTVLADANGLLSAPVSDSRLKRNIIPVSKYVDVLGLLKDEKKRGVFYNWKDPKRGTAQEIGFVAQGFEDIKGMTGTMNNTGYKYLNYDRVTAILWEQNRALLTRIEALEKMLNDLLKR